MKNSLDLSVRSVSFSSSFFFAGPNNCDFSYPYAMLCYAKKPLSSAGFPFSNCHLLTSIDDIKLNIKYRSDLERETERVEREGDPIISCVLYPHANEGSLYLVPFFFLHFISFLVYFGTGATNVYLSVYLSISAS